MLSGVTVLNSWARSPQAKYEPSLMAPSTHADFLWAQANQHALLANGVDPAWTGSSARSPGERKSLMFNLKKLERPAHQCRLHRVCSCTW